MIHNLKTPSRAPSSIADDAGHGNDRADAELAAILESYLAAIEAGHAPSAAELIAAHPHLAERLEGCLASLQFLEQAGEQIRPASATSSGIEPPASSLQSPAFASATLGDFRLIREIGRGGMGVVYEAEQLSLARRVAVKVLPFAAMLDERQLARFKNEARAAAGLHHPHIVPVYYVGAERGVHFYAMQYIEGQSLAEAVNPPPSKGGSTEHGRPESPERRCYPSRSDRGGVLDAPTVEHRPTPCELPQSSIQHPTSDLDTQPLAAAATLPDRTSPAYFRRIAELGVQAAEALHYAHESGVIHRDVKPSNLLVERSHLAPRDENLRLAERDGYQLWVADFGLARISADPAVTRTGDLVGTLRYMSPEQLRGKAAMVDHRTDVYSLGVTLYELLTHHPAFAADDSEQLLRQILETEPPAPRSLNRAIPADLETIVLKAIRPDAESRYATAQDLADDLRRFLTAKPIVARRPTLLDRTRMWVRRHTGVALVAGAALSAISVLAVLAALIIANAWREQGIQTRRADERLRFARRVVDNMYTKVAEGWLRDEPRMSPLQEEFLAKAAEFYRELAASAPDDAQSQADAAMAQWRLVAALEPLGRMGESETLLRDALAKLERSLAAQPNSAEFSHRWAMVAMNLAWVVGELGRPQEAVTIGAAAGQRWEELSRQFPHERKYRRFLLDLSHNLGASLVFTIPIEAEPHLRRALTGYERALAARNLPSVSAETVATARLNLAYSLLGQDRFAAAEAELAAAIAGLESLGPKGPRSSVHLVAKAWSARASALLGLQRNPEAAQAIDNSAALYEPLVKEFIDLPIYRLELDETLKLRDRLPRSLLDSPSDDSDK